MDRYIDVPDEVFEALQNHLTDLLVLHSDMAKDFQVGDCLKLYHPSNPEEALRIQIDRMDFAKTESGEGDILFHCTLLEWIFRIETELDQILREEKELNMEYFF